MDKTAIYYTILFLVCPMYVSAGTLIFDYGFEDWTGDAATTPDYFSSTDYYTYWEDHITGTEVVRSGDPDCGGRDAHSGDHYFHQGFYTGGEDPCLGTTPDSIDPHTNIGFDGRYPADPKNNLKLSDMDLSNILTIRLYFRVTGEWPNEDMHNGNKFLRLYSGGNANQIISVSDDGTTIDITDHPLPGTDNPSWGDYHNRFTSPVNWDDDRWHSLAAKFERFDTPKENGDVLNVCVWIDDWDMEGDAVGCADTYHEGWYPRWDHLVLMVNWDAENPTSLMGIDFDDIEIWDGLPDKGVCEAAEGSRCWYVSPDGDDSGDGTIDDPWRTFENAVSDIISPGDIIYARGGVYSEYAPDLYNNGESILPIYRYAGLNTDPERPVTFRSYPGETAVLDPGSEHPGILIQGDDKEGIIIDGFEIRNAWGAGIVIEGNPKNIIIRNNHIHDVDGSIGANIGCIRSNSAINVIIENNTLHDSYIHAEKDNNNGAGIFIFSGTTNFTIRGNNIYSSKHGIFYKHSGYGKSEFYDNHIHDVWGNGFMIASDNVTMKNNLVVNCVGSGFDIHEEAGCRDCTRNNIITHNTVVNCSSPYILNRGSDRPGAINTHITDNIFYQCGIPHIWQYGTDEEFFEGKPKLVSNNNVYWNDDNSEGNTLLFDYFGSGGVWGDAGDRYTLDEFQSMGFEIMTIDEDPLLDDDYSLKHGSPATGAASDGTDIGFSGHRCVPVHKADTKPCDGRISLQEFMDHIFLWMSGHVSEKEILDLIIIWKNI